MPATPSRPVEPGSGRASPRPAYPSVSPGNAPRRRCVIAVLLVFAARAGEHPASCRSRCASRVMAGVRADRAGAHARPRAPCPGCVTCGRMPSTTSPPPSAPGWRCRRRLRQLGDRGPEELRPAFAAFAEDYRTTGRFHDCLDRLKDRLSDPVGDRLVESPADRPRGGRHRPRPPAAHAVGLPARGRPHPRRARDATGLDGQRGPARRAPHRGSCSRCCRPAPSRCRPTARPPASPSWLVGAAVTARRLPADGADRPAARGRAGAAMSGSRGGASGWSWLGALVGAVVGLGLLLVIVGLPVSPTAGPRRAGSCRTCATRPRPSRLLDRTDVRRSPVSLALLRPRSCPTWPGWSSGSSAARRRCAAGSCAPGCRRTSTGSAPSRSSGALSARSSGSSSACSRCCSAVRRRSPVVLLVVCVAGAGIIGRDHLLTRAANRRERAHAHRVPHGRRAARPRRRRRRGRDRRPRPGLPALARRAVGRARRLPRRRPRGRQPAHRAAGSGRPHRPDQPVAGSSTASSSPSSAAPRWPTSCAPRRRTSARPAAAPSWRRAGRKEIAMMVPVVFLILPVTVLFAIYPGVAFLRLAV